MLLQKLISNCPKNIKKIDINGLSLDSRKIKKGNLFFALKGNKLDGSKFIKHAINKGASVIICEKAIRENFFPIPVIKLKNIRKILSEVCQQYYKKMPKNIIAVTGTNGKTSVADFYYQILNINKIPVASIGTLGIKKRGQNKKTGLTSPDIISIYKELNTLKGEGIDNVIIEASSHGLSQGRLEGLNFKAGIFTNFSQDHLDYHKNMKNYFDAKMILFKKLLKKNNYIITNEKLKEFHKIKKIAIKKKIKIITNIHNIYEYKKTTNLFGLFQIMNLQMSIAAARLCGLSMPSIIKSLKKIKNVNGRMEFVKKFKDNVNVYVDYAHTPAALETVLSTFKKESNKHLSLVFGCGGLRDVKKRNLMAKIAQKYCKKIYVTDDNPRKENPKKIRRQIISNLKKSNYIEIANRSKAIKTAINNAQPFETILVAGKGHEEYQDYGAKIIKFSDKKIIKSIRLKYNRKKLNLEHNSKILNKVLNNKRKCEFEGVSINSKSIKKGNLFIAIKGKNNDGNNYVRESLKKGANLSITTKNFNNKKIIKVKNTHQFLNKLAVKKREKSNAIIIAVTGSVGKTTIKTLLGIILSSFGKTYYSPRSFNNHYGVPLSLSNLERDHLYGVFEIGMSRRGEINKLSKLVNPDIAIISNIAEAHIENFKNIKDIAKAKGEIINNIKKNGTLIINRDDKFFSYFNRLAKMRNLNVVSFGFRDNSDIFLIDKKNQKVNKINALNEIISLNKNSFNTYNVLSIIAVLKSLSLNLKKIPKIFKTFRPIEGRGKIHNVFRYGEKFKLIDESYNANPLSVKESIINFSKIKKNKAKKYLLLSDMLELGNNSDLYHKNLSKFINKTDIDKFFVYGDKILNTYKYTNKNKRGNIFQSAQDVDEIFSNLIKQDDYLMIKGSNSTGLNKVSKKIIKGEKIVI